MTAAAPAKSNPTSSRVPRLGGGRVSNWEAIVEDLAPGTTRGKALDVDVIFTPTISAEMGYRIVKRGISSRVLDKVAIYLDLGKAEVATYLDMDRTTAQRKAARDEPLPTHAAEGLLRLLELEQMAADTFSTPEEAAQWLRRPHPMLDHEAPLECAKSAFGAQRVKDILVALKYGGVV
jgi:putative toxin-antitoxin system antitoxin component (TIGR02293 family)